MFSVLSINRVLALVLFVSPLVSVADVYVRDYTHRAGDADSKITSRVIALDQVKKLLLEEIGVHVMSRMDVTKTSDGSQYAAEEIETLTAGVVSVVVVDEKWDGLTYYLKAKMEADPDDVLKAISEFKNHDASLAEQLELERRALKQARAELKKYKEGFSSYKGERLLSATRDYDDNVKVIRAYDYVERGIQLQRAGGYKEAAELLGEAHRLGNERATIVLATLYLSGRGVKLDISEATRLLLKLKDRIEEKADKGEIFYQNVLGIMYNTGIGGVNKNIERAIYWFKRAAEKDYFPSIINLASVYTVDGKYYLAKDLYQRLVDSENSLGYFYMAGLYKNGKGVEVDSEKAFRYYNKSAELGLSNAYTALASYYLDGVDGQNIDHKKAMSMFKRAADLGEPNSYAGIGLMYMNGMGVDKDNDKARTYFMKGADHGSPSAYFYLGYIFMNGIGVDRDADRAEYWFIKAYELGNRNASTYLKQLKNKL